MMWTMIGACIGQLHGGCAMPSGVPYQTLDQCRAAIVEYQVTREDNVYSCVPKDQSPEERSNALSELRERVFRERAK